MKVRMALILAIVALAIPLALERQRLQKEHDALIARLERVGR